MNRIYRLIWNHTLGALVPVSEIVRAKGGGVTRRSRAVGLRLSPLGGALALALSLSPTVALAQRPMALIEARETFPAHQVSIVQPATATPRAVPSDVLAPSSHPLPTGGQVVSGQVGFTQDGHTLTIDQSSQKAIIDWQSFDIGSGSTVTFHQPGRDSVALNRVLGSDPSAIYGHLNANGQVFLVNPYGVYFAPGAQVDVGGLVASTLNLSDNDFLQGHYHFGGSSSAGVRNDGSIRAAQGGYVAMIGRRTNNTGGIATPGGTTALGAGGSVSLTLAGQELVSFQVNGAALDALAANGGVIAADGGRVILSAQAKDALLQTVVNNQGRIQAQTVQNHGGTIDLLGGDAGTVQVAGTLDASAPTGDGGAIETSGAHVTVADGAVITEKSHDSKDGHWLIDPQDFTIATNGGDISGATLSASLDNGDVTIQSSDGRISGAGDILVNDSVSWSAHTLTLHADRNIVVNAPMNGSGTAGLFLAYGQGASDGVIDGVAADYLVNAPINLASTSSFATQLGTSGKTISYTILTSLGAPGSVTGIDLQGINGSLAGHYVLGSDIDASETATWNSGAGFDPIGGTFRTTFIGTFDGLGHTVTKLTIDRPSRDNVGLFGFVGRDAAVRNIGLLNASVTGNSNVGGLAGVNYVGASINNAYATGSVVGRGSYIGGLVGSNSGGAITNVYATDSVRGVGNVGGLVGSNYGGLITNAYATGSASGSTNVGGLLGESNNAGALYGGIAAIRNVYATGSVSGHINVGGLIGWNAGSSSIDNAYANGSVTGSRNIGGLAGENTAIIANVYATGAVSGSSSVGGLVGDNENEASSAGTITNGYWDATTTGQSRGVGASRGTITGGGALTTAQLEAALPAGFDAGTWGNIDNQTTPYLLANASFNTVSGSVLLGTDAGTTPTAYNIILTLDQLQNINSTGLTANYVLGANIDASATAHWNEGDGFYPIGNPGTEFTGIFDGLGHTITALVIDRPSSDFVGLFGVVGKGGVLRNINLDRGLGDITTGRSSVGYLAGINRGAISDVGIRAFVGGTSNVGGLVGQNDGTISDAHSFGPVIGTNNNGGLVGANYGTITNAYAVSSVPGDGSKSARIGGLVGLNAGTISNSYADSFTGGTGVGDVGGLVGSNSGTISSVYATGSTSGAHAGGLVGANVGGTVSHGYWDITTTGQQVGIGANSGSFTGSGLTTAQLASTLPDGFDAADWGNAGNQTTPYLLSSATSDTANGAVFLGSDTRVEPQTFAVILTLSQLQRIGNGDYVLATDIDATPTASWNGGAGFAPVNNEHSHGFGGIFDGLGHTITGLTINRPSSDNVGLFAAVGSGTIVRNLGFVGGSVIGQDQVGSLAGVNNGNIQNVYVTGSVSGSYEVGDLVGSNAGYIRNVHATGSVHGTDHIGGLVGFLSDGTINNSYALGDVSGRSEVGGLVGRSGVFGGAISNVYASGSVSGTNDVGGLIGRSTNGSSVINAYATGSVRGTNNVGGLVGFNNNSSVLNAYAAGSVSGTSYVGGLIGFNEGNITNTYATGHVSGTNDVGGLIGASRDMTVANGYWDIDTTSQSVGVGSNQGIVTGGGGLTTNQMHQQSSFAGFDFDTPVWVIYEGHTAPLLKAFLTDLTVTADDQTQTYTGGTFTLSNPRFSINGADTSGHLFGLDDPYDGAVNVGTYAADLWSDQQGYFITIVGGGLTIAPAVSGLVAQGVDEKSSGDTQVTLDVPHLQLAGAATGQDSSAGQSIGPAPAQTLTSASR